MHLTTLIKHNLFIYVLCEIAEKVLSVPITKLGDANELQLDTEYTISNYKNSADATKEGATQLKVTFATPATTPTLTIAFEATSKTQYTATFSLKTAPGAVTIPVVFTAGTAKSTINVEFAAAATSATKVIDIVDAAADGKLVKETAYTITSEGYTCDVGTFTPGDLTKLTIASKLTPAEEGKKDGAKDKIALTIENDLLPATLPEAGKQELKLTTVAATSNAEYVLNKSDKITLTHSKGKIVVDYLFNDCKVAAGTDLTADLTINDDLKFTAQAFKYAEGAKSVASVVAALFAVLALVF
ncbi:hypothetical protein BLNAU_9491 [Blattamonas nauphoetae]|uniref:Uncharacterized protein n=1 Tax=Blattamonas nauphoetae TaxID=2049346 RepID=A0ABQ9XVX6_9EUKA|nr:hypothetical protein BLNAU_9491 [Blattamonas nauphoetae]